MYAPQLEFNHAINLLIKNIDTAHLENTIREMLQRRNYIAMPITCREPDCVLFDRLVNELYTRVPSRQVRKVLDSVTLNKEER